MSVYLFALGIKSANGLVKSTINTANAFCRSGVETTIINILGKNGGFDFLDPAFPLEQKVNKYSLDALAETYKTIESLSQVFHNESQQFLKAIYYSHHEKALKDINNKLTENDLIIFSHPLAMVLFAKANMETKAKTLIQVHGNYIEETDNLNLLKDYIDYIDYIQTVSKYMKDDLINILGFPKEKVVCIYNITHPIALKKKKEKYLKRISIVGSVQPRKNQLDAIKMLSLISDRNVVLQIYGHILNKEYFKLLKMYIDNYNLQDRVIFKDVAKEKDIYENTDIAVMPSIHEGFGYIFLESALYNIPIVAYDFKYGAKEFTKNNQNGCLIDMGDYRKMAETVTELLENKDKYQDVVTFNRTHFEEEYSEDSILREYNKLFINKNAILTLSNEIHRSRQEEKIDVSDIKLEDIEILQKKFWDDSMETKKAYKITFVLKDINVKGMSFSYIYKKSKFDINHTCSVKKKSLLNKENNHYNIEIIIPKENRLSLNKPIDNISIVAVISNKKYIIGDIVQGSFVLNQDPSVLKKDDFIEIIGNKNISNIEHILKPNGFWIRYPSFEAIRDIRNEEGEILPFTTSTFKFYGKEPIFFKLNQGLYKLLTITMNSGKTLTLDFSKYSYKSVFLKLQKIESDFRLFDLKIQNIYFWELIRAVIFEHILEATGVLDQHFSKSRTVKDFYFSHKSLKDMKPNKKLIFEFPRRSKKEYRTLAIQNMYKENSNVISYPQENGYDDLCYLDNNFYPIKSFNDFCKEDKTTIDYTGEEKKIIRWLKSLFIEHFSIDIEFSLFIHSRLVKFKREFTYFNDLFKNSIFNEVLIPSAYWSAGIIAAAKENNIITSDIQYAIISKYHPSFAFAAPRAYGSDRVYLWSKYWNIKEIPYNKSVISDGNYFTEKLADLNINIDNNVPNNKVAFISQSRIGRKLFNFALDFAKENPKIDIVFCPHPDEDFEKYSRGKELEHIRNLTVFDGKDTLLAINDSKHVIGVYSTALIEAVALRKSVYILKISGYEIFERECENGFMDVISSIDELTTRIANNSNKKVGTKVPELLYNLIVEE